MEDDKQRLMREHPTEKSLRSANIADLLFAKYTTPHPVTTNHTITPCLLCSPHCMSCARSDAYLPTTKVIEVYDLVSGSWR